MDKVLKHIGAIRSIKFFPNDLALFQYLGTTDEYPDLITLDLHLPLKGGLQILKSLKKDLRWKNIPVMMTCNEASQFEILACYKAGAESFLVESILF
ncbi:response regulator [Larkinella rosea]|nr:response regulator [Larkinella rosea]